MSNNYREMRFRTIRGITKGKINIITKDNIREGIKIFLKLRTHTQKKVTLRTKFIVI